MLINNEEQTHIQNANIQTIQKCRERMADKWVEND